MKKDVPLATERRSPGRRSDHHPGARPRTGVKHIGSDYTPDEFEFMKAIDNYKRQNGRPFPAWSEVLNVLVALGYRKVAEPDPRLRTLKKISPRIRAKMS